MLKLRRGNAPPPPVLRTVATNGTGLDELCEWLERRDARGSRCAATARGARPSAAR